MSRSGKVHVPWSIEEGRVYMEHGSFMGPAAWHEVSEPGAGMAFKVKGGIYRGHIYTGRTYI
jgi:hypothetical protein